MFAGPTLFTPMLTEVAALSQSENVGQNHQKYSILLILTDGTVNDMETTIKGLIHASGTPVSVVIVGVGNENFGDMKRLDADAGLLTSGTEKATRDVVQFVSYKEIMGQGSSVLAQQVLAEVIIFFELFLCWLLIISFLSPNRFRIKW
jgi:hypothetical protein